MDHGYFSWAANVAAGGTIVGALVGLLPALAASVALVWYVIQIHESETVKRWMAARRARRIAALKAKLVLLEAQNETAPTPGAGA